MTAAISPDRRRLLLLAAAGAGALWLAQTAGAQPRWQSNPFSLGVASGSPTHESVVLWTRVLDGGWLPAQGGDAVSVRWEVAHDEKFARVAQRGNALASAELAHSVHVEVAGLEPDRWYFYRFISGDAVSAMGRTRTFPAPDTAAQRLRLAYASCQRWDHGRYAAWRHMADENLDLVLFLGDYIYEYPSAAAAVRFFPHIGWAQTLQDYRQRYELHKGDADLQRMHAACPWLVTWDDHEVQNDYAGLQAGVNGPEVADFSARRAAAYQAFYEHMPLRAATLTRALAGLQGGAELRLYGQHRFGRLATLLTLDTRQYRDPQVCNTGGRRGASLVNPTSCAAWSDPARSLLGTAQEQWVDRAASDVTQGWTVLGQQYVFGQRDAVTGTNEALWNDGWDGYEAARRRMVATLQKTRGAGPVILGGDVHENWVGHVKTDYRQPASAAVGVEFCGTSITSRAGSGDKAAGRLAANPHFVFADSTHRGYGVAQFTPGLLTTTLRGLDDATRSDARVQTLAQFTVQAGRPVIERV